MSLSLSLSELTVNIIRAIFYISSAGILCALGLHLQAFYRGSKLWNMGRLLVGQALCFLVFVVVFFILETIAGDSRFWIVVGIIGVLCFLLFVALSILILIRLYAYLQHSPKEKGILIGFIVLYVVLGALEIFGNYFWGEDNVPNIYDILTNVLSIFNMALVEWLLILFIGRFKRLNIYSDECDE